MTTQTNPSASFGGNTYTFVQGIAPNPPLCVQVTTGGNPTPTPTYSDNDFDGLEDNVENSLADGFTPFYHVSVGENSGTGFATFNNSLSFSVNQPYGSVLPVSYYRVKPFEIYNINGVRTDLFNRIISRPEKSLCAFCFHLFRCIIREV